MGAAGPRHRVVLQGEYVTLNYYPLDDSAVNALLQKRMGPRWVSWYGADLDLRMTVLILICLNPSRDLQVGSNGQSAVVQHNCFLA